MDRKEEKATAVAADIMHDEIHLLLAISSSMIVTFALHCGMKDLPPRDSPFQHVGSDSFHEVILLFRCSHYDRRSEETCLSFFLPEDFVDTFVIAVSTFVSILLTLWYTAEAINHFRHVVVTFCAVDLLGRWFDFFRILDHVDIATVYFFAWQLISLVWKWMWHQLASPILLIEQASLCIFLSVTAFVFHHTAFRYVPKEINLVVFWILSLVDIFLCLHPRGLLRIPAARKARCAFPTNCPGAYYTGIDGERRGLALGFGDFLGYNLMVLLALPPSPSTPLTTQLWITVGSIVSIAIGHLLTGWLQRTYQQREIPAFPLPVMTYTAYVLLLDAIRDNPIPCAID